MHSAGDEAVDEERHDLESHCELGRSARSNQQLAATGLDRHHTAGTGLDSERVRLSLPFFTAVVVVSRVWGNNGILDRPDRVPFGCNSLMP